MGVIIFTVGATLLGVALASDVGRWENSIRRRTEAGTGPNDSACEPVGDL